MTIAEELKAEGRAEGMIRGALIGQIQALDRVLGRKETSSTVLAERSLDELRLWGETMHAEVRLRLADLINCANLSPVTDRKEPSVEAPHALL